MKIFFVIVLVLNLLLEGMAGVGLLLGPDGIEATVMPATGMWAMNYGFAALAIASAIIWLWPNRTNSQAVGSVMGMLSTFHVLLAISMAIPGNQMGPMIAHSVMAVLCVVALTQRNKWCDG
jgi:hypothetical protein